MKFLTVLSLLPLALAIPSPQVEPVKPADDIAGPAADVKATDASSAYPFARLLGPTVEGASIDSSGTLHAVNKTHLVNLKTGAVIFTKIPNVPDLAADVTQQFSSSRKISKNGGWLLGDAFGHIVHTINGGKAEDTYKAAWIQPNDMTVSNNGKNVYFAGNNYSAGVGDVWYSLDKAAPVKIPLSDKMYRANGIDLSPDDKWLFTTSVQMGTGDQQFKVLGSSVWKIELNSDGKPKGDWSMAIDLAKAVNETAAFEAGMDPDGMRMDVNGYMYSTLNAFQRVLKWNTNKPTEFEVIGLDSVIFPTNLELGGEGGKTLFVIGKCKADGMKTSCVDQLPVKAAGREFERLKSGDASQGNGTSGGGVTKPQTPEGSGAGALVVPGLGVMVLVHLLGAVF